jgi:hypothetical protein
MLTNSKIPICPAHTWTGISNCERSITHVVAIARAGLSANSPSTSLRFPTEFSSGGQRISAVAFPHFPQRPLLSPQQSHQRHRHVRQHRPHRSMSQNQTLNKNRSRKVAPPAQTPCVARLAKSSTNNFKPDWERYQPDAPYCELVKIDVE